MLYYVEKVSTYSHSRYGINSVHKKKDRRDMDEAIDLDLFCKQYKQNRVQMPLMTSLCSSIATQNNHLFKKKGQPTIESWTASR